MKSQILVGTRPDGKQCLILRKYTAQTNSKASTVTFTEVNDNLEKVGKPFKTALHNPNFSSPEAAFTNATGIELRSVRDIIASFSLRTALIMSKEDIDYINSLPRNVTVEPHNKATQKKLDELWVKYFKSDTLNQDRIFTEILKECAINKNSFGKTGLSNARYFMLSWLSSANHRTNVSGLHYAQLLQGCITTSAPYYTDFQAHIYKQNPNSDV